MDSIAPTRLVALLLSLGSGMLFAQSTLPSTTPTAPPAPSVTVSTPASPTVTTHAAHHADISFVQGQLEIAADDSSLNQILREIGRLTGITITGGVADQRVFGKYGPAALPTILTSLLQGTGSNMLLLNGALDVPGELILTPQQGGPTPPNPNASGLEDDTPQASRGAERIDPRPLSRSPYPASIMVPPPRPRLSAVPQQNSSPTFVPAADPNTIPPPTDNPQSPNGVQTPQQVYQQLQQLQNAQPKQ